MKSIKRMFSPTFLDFIKAGEQINVITAIDFTSLNGNPSFPDSLHANKPGLNEYETVMNHTI